MSKRWTLNFDGACEPRNPGGWLAWAWILDANGVEFTGSSVRPPTPSNTNNQAEYFALGFGLKKVRELIEGGAHCDELLINGDSKLVIEQLLGRWACNKLRLLELRGRCRELIGDLRWHAEWIPRAQNERADALGRAALAEQGLGV